jgi:hypothetical protein
MPKGGMTEHDLMQMEVILTHFEETVKGVTSASVIARNLIAEVRRLAKVIDQLHAEQRGRESADLETEVAKYRDEVNRTIRKR